MSAVETGRLVVRRGAATPRRGMDYWTDCMTGWAAIGTNRSLLTSWSVSSLPANSF